MPKQQNTEWKREWSDTFLKQICGFANAVGVSKVRRPKYRMANADYPSCLDSK